MAQRPRASLRCLLLAAAATVVAGTASPDAASAEPPCVRDRLARRNVTAAELVAHAGAACPPGTPGHARSFFGPSLGYVTPWNGGGYDTAVAFAHKLDMVAPVWWQIRDAPEGGGATTSVVLTGEHDVDAGWVTRLREAGRAGAGRAPRVLPRVAWEARRADPQAMRDAAFVILAAIKRHGLDGVVLEAQVHPAFLPLVKALATGLGRLAEKKAKEGEGAAVEVAADGSTTAASGLPTIPPYPLVFVTPPSLPSSGPSTLAIFAPHVTFFSVMTYDYSSSRGLAGPNAPLSWAKSVIQSLAPDAAGEEGTQDASSTGISRSQLLLGLPFYGYDGAEPVVARDVLDALSRGGARYATGAPLPRLKTHREGREHYVTVRGKELPPREHTVYFPSPWSTAERLAAAKELGVGVAVWELGQGLPALMDVF